EESEEAEDDDHVVQVGHDAGHGELPFEAEGQVDHDADDDHQQRHQAVLDQLTTYLRPHELYATQFDIRCGRLQGPHDAFALHGRRLAFTYRQPDHDVARSAEVLDLEVGVAQVGHGASDFVQLSG